MAAKKGKTTKQYRQARKAAKPAAKAAFPGKVKASRKDPKIKISAEDRIALKEMRDTAKADLGKNAYLSKAEYEANQAKAREAFRSQMRTEFGEYGGKKATPEEIAMRETKAGGRTTPKKKTVKKVSAKGPSLVEDGKVVSESRAKEIMSGEKKSVVKKSTTKKKAAVKKAAPSKPSAPATSKSATVTEPSTKPSVKKPTVKKTAAKKPSVKKAASAPRPTDASLTKMEDDYINKTRERLIKEGKLSGSKEIAIRPKGEVVSTRTGTVATTRPTPIPGSDTVVKKGSKLKKLGKFGVVSAALAAGLDAKNMIEGSKRKAQAEADLFYEQKGRNRNAVERVGDVATKALPTAGKQLAKYFTMGLAGEDVSVGAAKAEKQLKQYRQKKLMAQAAKNAKMGLRYGPSGESLVPGTSAYKKGSKTRPSVSNAAPGGTTGGATGGKSGATPGAGGSTITATPGSTYTVKKGDTLSAIAKASGVSLAEIRKANKKFATNPKYKQGNMIWSGTKVNIPKK